MNQNASILVGTLVSIGDVSVNIARSSINSELKCSYEVFQTV